MGVPLVTLVGKQHMSRVGLSILSRLGLEFFAASTPEEYVAKATSLANNVEALGRIRSSLRDRMATSELCNAKSLAQNVEQAYRTMWRRWCEGESGGGANDEGVSSVDSAARLQAEV